MQRLVLFKRTAEGKPIIARPLSGAEGFNERGSKRNLAGLGDDQAQAVAELDAHLSVGRLTEFDFNESRVCDAPRLGNGWNGQPPRLRLPPESRRDLISGCVSFAYLRSA
jgi:hypothetical protein